MADNFSLIILGLSWLAQIFRPSFLNRYLKTVWRFSLAAIFGVSLYSAFLQYQIWKGSPLARFFLPPYQNIAYFFSYVGWRIFAPPTAALLASVFISRLAMRLNERFGNRFLEEEEYRLLGLGIFLTGYPGFFFYLIFMLLAGILHSAFFILHSNQGRAPLYYWWLPVAIFVIIIKNWFLPASLLNLFIL